MLSIGVVRSSMAAPSYFAKDNYYTQHEQGPAHWFGAGAEQLGLDGAVEAARFKELLEGRIDADTLLGRGTGEQRQHLHGWDLTFSAPKSISLTALVGGDERLIATHDAAVREALGWLQEKALVTRTGRDGKTIEEHTGAMVAAVFRHDLSRAAEPQLHSHAVVMNATLGAQGEWRSIWSNRLYYNAKEAGERYQQALAVRAAELGYGIVPSRNGTFELEGVPRELSQLFSSRAQAIEARLAAQGLTRASASLAQRESATLLTRGAKPEVDRERQRSQDRALARTHGLDLERFVGQAKQNSHAQDLDRASSQGRPQTSEAALRAVREAAATLSERDAAFTDKSLQERARVMSLGLADARQIEHGIARLQQQGELLERQVRAIDPVTKKPTLAPGWTTAAMIETERRMLALEQAGRGGVDRLMHGLDAQALIGQARALAEERGLAWTQGQVDATRGILTTSSRVLGVQGYAGTAKTTTVLATVAAAARQLGYTVKGMAPTTDATLGLAQAIGGEAVTVQRQVAELTRGNAGPHPAGRQLWIVDEASLVGAGAMHTLLAGATLQNTRVLLVGDEKQLGSVEAGRAFGQLQAAGMPTFRLTEIVRQSNEATKEAVHAALQADAGKALVRGVRPGETLAAAMAAWTALLGRTATPPALMIDPRLFRRYAVAAVPTLVDAGSGAQLRGTVSPSRLAQERQQQAGRDLGRIGPTWPIAEPDLAAVLRKAAERLDLPGRAAAALARFWRQVPAIALPPVTTSSVRRIRPMARTSTDLRDHAGRLLLAARSELNPLEQLPLTARILVIDAQDPRELAWAKTQRAEHRATIHLITNPDRAGGWPAWQALQEALDAPAFLLDRHLAGRLGVQATPSLIEAKGLDLVITETALPRAAGKASP